MAARCRCAREPASLLTDLIVISDAFVVVVVGGMGSITGAYLAAVIIAEVKALCISIGTASIAGVAFNFSKLTLVAEFLVMAVVLIVRPHGLLGRRQMVVRSLAEPEEPLRPASTALKAVGAGVVVALALTPLLAGSQPYVLVLGIDVLLMVLFATSLHFIMGPGGMHSFGHAAYFGLGAYGAGLLVKWFAATMPFGLLAAPVLALLGALLFGWFAVRLSGVYLAMLTLAFAQIVWSIATQWGDLTGGSNGILGIWPSPPFDLRPAFFLLTAALTVLGVLLLRRLLFAPFGYAMRAGRDSPLRAEAIGIDVRRVHWIGFAIAGALAGVAGGLFAFAKGSISPETIDVGRSIDGVGDGAARRHPDTDWSDRRRLGFCGLAGYRDAPDRILACVARRNHPGTGVAVPGWHCRWISSLATTACWLMNTLEVAKLCKSFGGVRAVDAVSFAVRPGEFLALIGPNGAGKSTCFNMINGQLAPDSGSIRFAGQEIAGLPSRDDLASRGWAYLPGRRDVCLHDRRGERTARVAVARRRDLPRLAAGGTTPPRARPRPAGRSRNARCRGTREP